MPALKTLTPALDEGSPTDLLSIAETATWLGVSSAFLDIGRRQGYGPPFKHLGARNIKYQRSDVAAWLLSRTFTKSPDEHNRSPVRTVAK